MVREPARVRWGEMAHNATGGLIGARLKRLEDPRLLTGRGRYVADIAGGETDALHAAFVRSPFANAGIAHIRTEAALQAAGVVAVLQAADEAVLAAPLPS